MFLDFLRLVLFLLYRNKYLENFTISIKKFFIENQLNSK